MRWPIRQDAPEALRVAAQATGVARGRAAFRPQFSSRADGHPATVVNGTGVDVAVFLAELRVERMQEDATDDAAPG